jgi:hypothetical protein
MDYTCHLATQGLYTHADQLGELLDKLTDATGHTIDEVTAPLWASDEPGATKAGTGNQ